MDKFIAHYVGCTSPLPSKCPMCKKGNMGNGFDYCYLNHELNAEHKRGQEEMRERIAAEEDALADEYNNAFAGHIKYAKEIAKHRARAKAIRALEEK